MLLSLKGWWHFLWLLHKTSNSSWRRPEISFTFCLELSLFILSHLQGFRPSKDLNGLFLCYANTWYWLTFREIWVQVLTPSLLAMGLINRLVNSLGLHFLIYIKCVIPGIITRQLEGPNEIHPFIYWGPTMCQEHTYKHNYSSNWLNSYFFLPVELLWPLLGP